MTYSYIVDYEQENKQLRADLKLCREALDSLEECFDPQIYAEQVKQDFDAPDDFEYCVNLPAGLWRQLGKVMARARQWEE